GELAVLPELIRGHPSPTGFDLTATCIGTVALDRIVTGRESAPGDALIGLPSSGLHSNGYSLARLALGGLALDSRPEVLGGATLAASTRPSCGRSSTWAAASSPSCPKPPPTRRPRCSPSAIPAPGASAPSPPTPAAWPSAGYSSASDFEGYCASGGGPSDSS